MKYQISRFMQIIQDLMEKISRIAYGFRNFNNYRERVLLQCA